MYLSYSNLVLGYTVGGSQAVHNSVQCIVLICDIQTINDRLSGSTLGIFC